MLQGLYKTLSKFLPLAEQGDTIRLNDLKDTYVAAIGFSNSGNTLLIINDVLKVLPGGFVTLGNESTIDISEYKYRFANNVYIADNEIPPIVPIAVRKEGVVIYKQFVV